MGRHRHPHPPSWEGPLNSELSLTLLPISGRRAVCRVHYTGPVNVHRVHTCVTPCCCWLCGSVAQLPHAALAQGLSGAEGWVRCLLKSPSPPRALLWEASALGAPGCVGHGLQSSPQEQAVAGRPEACSRTHGAMGQPLSQGQPDPRPSAAAPEPS